MQRSAAMRIVAQSELPSASEARRFVVRSYYRFL